MERLEPLNLTLLGKIEFAIQNSQRPRVGGDVDQNQREKRQHHDDRHTSLAF